MKNFKKIAALLLALTMMLGLLAACGKDGEGDKDPQATPGFVYVPTYADLKSDEKIQYINTSCWHEGTIYFIASVYAGEQTYTPDAASGTDVVFWGMLVAAVVTLPSPKITAFTCGEST